MESRPCGDHAETMRRPGGGQAEISSGGDLLEVAQKALHVLGVQREKGVRPSGAQREEEIAGDVELVLDLMVRCEVVRLCLPPPRRCAQWH